MSAWVACLFVILLSIGEQSCPCAYYDARAHRLDDDLVSLVRKRCFDLAGTSGTAVYWNGTRLPVRSFVDYVDLYLGEGAGKKRGKGKEKGKRKSKKKGSDGETSDDSDVYEGERENGSEPKEDDDKENESPPEKQIIKIHEKMHRWEVVISQTGW